MKSINPDFAVDSEPMKNVILLAGMLLFAGPALAQGQWGRPYGGWHMGPGMMDGWGMGWFGMIFNLVFWILILVGLVFLIRWLIQSSRDRSGGSYGGGGSRALEILKERYARGEIDKQQYDSMKKDLMD